MHISFNELRRIKHSLPTGSVSVIAQKLEIEEQTVRNYFGARKYSDGKIATLSIEQGPDGGIVTLNDTKILEAAREIISMSN